MKAKSGRIVNKWTAGMICILFVMAICVIPTKAETCGFLTYEISSEEITITGCDTSASGDLVIPDTIDGYPVKSIGERAFEGCSSLASVGIPEGVTSIGESAFDYCSSLTSVGIPEGVTSIGKYAFYGCCDLRSVSIPSSVTSIGYDAFEGCISLTSVHITDLKAWCEIEFEKIRSNPVFYAESLYLNGEKITELVIPEGVTSIGKHAFVGCTSLTSVSITDLKAWCEIEFESESSNPLKYAGRLYLNGEEITELAIPEGVTSIGKYAFYGCRSLTSVSIPEGVTSIGDYAFENCSDLRSVSIPKGITSIGDYAFENCSDLRSVSIPSSVTSIGYDAFEGCISLTSVHITDLKAWCEIEFESKSSNPATGAIDLYLNGLYLNGEKITELVIPEGITSIGASAFACCRSLTSVSIPEGVTSISDDAFIACSSLTSVSIPEGVTSIGDYAFYNCRSLTSVSIPSSVTSIGSYAFRGCNNLTLGVRSEYAKNYAISNEINYVVEPSEIVIKTLPDKLKYSVGEEFVVQGMVLQANYYDGTTQDITEGYTIISGFDSSKAGTCTITVEYGGQTATFDVEIVKENMKLTSATLELQNDISILFKINVGKVDNTYSNIFVIVEHEMENGAIRSTTIEGVLGEDGTYYGFRYNGVSAKEVGDSLDITVYAYDAEGNLVTGETKQDYSVKSYCDTQLAKTDAQFTAQGMSVARRKAFRTLLVDLLNYASQAQKYFTYKTDELVNSDLTQVQKAYASSDSVLDTLQNVTDASYTVHSNPTGVWKAVGIVLLSKTTVRVKFEYKGDISQVRLVARVVGDETVTITDFEEAGGSNLYYAYFDNMTAAQLGTPIYFQLKKIGESTLLSNTLKYSVESYAYKKKTDATVGPIVSALMKYSKAAVNFNNTY